MSSTAVLTATDLFDLEEMFAADGLDRFERADARRAERRPQYRLTRRGRAVVLVLSLLAVLTVGVLFAGGSVATSDHERLHTVVVAPGDTLWNIASEASDGGDVVAMMHHIEKLNGLDSVDLMSGQRLRVPVAD